MCTKTKPGVGKGGYGPSKFLKTFVAFINFYAFIHLTPSKFFVFSYYDPKTYLRLRPCMWTKASITDSVNIDWSRLI